MREKSRIIMLKPPEKVFKCGLVVEKFPVLCIVVDPNLLTRLGYPVKHLLPEILVALAKVAK